MTSRIRSRHSRSPRGPNDIQYQLAQFPCGTHNPMERERVCREIQPEDIDFGDPHIACKERDIPENWQSAHQRTNEARQAHPIRECLFTKDPRSSAPTTDLTTAQMFIQGNRLPRTPPRDSSPRLPDSTNFYHSIEDRESHDIIQDFRDVRTVIHDWSPRKLWLLHQGLNYYQSRQYCLMPCHLCVEEEDGITYRCRQFDHAYQNNEKLVSGYITNAYVTNIFINEDHRLALIQLEDHLRVGLSEYHFSLLPKRSSADSCFLLMWHRARPRTLSPFDCCQFLVGLALIFHFAPQQF